MEVADMNDTGAVHGFATFDGGLGFASAKVFAEKPAGGNPQKLSVVKPVEGASRIPESLKQYEIPWSRFEPCGWWKFWNCLRNFTEWGMSGCPERPSLRSGTGSAVKRHYKPKKRCSFVVYTITKLCYTIHNERRGVRIRAT